jgi:hypothetical protein
VGLVSNVSVSVSVSFSKKKSKQNLARANYLDVCVESLIGKQKNVTDFG